MEEVPGTPGTITFTQSGLGITTEAPLLVAGRKSLRKVDMMDAGVGAGIGVVV
ncbi:MAG: hypothetical protein U9N12_02530 [Euryarchaeota archaeon]|nr:hypothetical protein [Euryarchaeota archaeon]